MENDITDVGWFLSFTEEEREIINARLEDCGYELDNEGLKNYIMDCAASDNSRPDEGQPWQLRLARMISEHPEEFQRVSGMASAGVSAILQAIRKKRAPGT